MILSKYADEAFDKFPHPYLTFKSLHKVEKIFIKSQNYV